ncbi:MULTISPECIES: EF-hand domain-containing protein [Rhizobium/Agrobacterium group]|uniref:EF-hand domain-containing protein n=2 Tax=Neorhizobium TaxID=1525371 RepID=A0ABV0MBY2_9HYPH|nr:MULTISPECIES: EF-hand domain-containing protein [Rhizobium/Agrobacterium group]KGD98585.1 membrane protein [Rhizobium sp. YS-1r]MCC2609694.1 EF-hand domain-containing protein [Neorhizobium petrolearium]WGI69891.1 EF-hand domain-containing protein [Neorhizobium petrolearium]
MRTTTIPAAVLLAAAIAVGSAGFALAQTSGADPHHPADSSQAASPSGTEGVTGQGQGTLGSDMMPGGMMGRGMMMQPGMMGGMPPMGMRGQMMKIMFAIADTDGDGALSFEEVTAVHKRIFDSVDANKDGKVTPEEMQAFWRQ